MQKPKQDTGIITGHDCTQLVSLLVSIGIIVGYNTLVGVYAHINARDHQQVKEETTLQTTNTHVPRYQGTIVYTHISHLIFRIALTFHIALIIPRRGYAIQNYFY